MKSHRSAGFTLVELLVVIGIILLLMSALLSAISGVRQFTMKTNGNATARLMARAFCDFYNWYGYWPNYPASSGPVDINCLNTLRPEGNTNSNNFLQAFTSAISTNATGQLVDPWGNTYTVMVDTINGMRGSVNPTGAGTLTSGVAVFTTNRSGAYLTKSW